MHHGALTVRQTLDFAAKLRMSSTATARDRDRRVAAMVTMLGLGGECMNTRTGGSCCVLCLVSCVFGKI